MAFSTLVRASQMDCGSKSEGMGILGKKGTGGSLRRAGLRRALEAWWKWQNLFWSRATARHLRPSARRAEQVCCGLVAFTG